MYDIGELFFRFRLYIEILNFICQIDVMSFEQQKIWPFRLFLRTIQLVPY